MVYGMLMLTLWWVPISSGFVEKKHIKNAFKAKIHINVRSKCLLCSQVQASRMAILVEIADSFNLGEVRNFSQHNDPFCMLSCVAIE